MIKRRVIESDFGVINKWFGLRGEPNIPKGYFPDVGFIAENVGAGFLYQTDSTLCFIDGYISNPASTKAEREDAFEWITRSLLLTAKEHKFTMVLAYSQNPAVKKWCDKFNFELKGEYRLYAREV